MVQQYMELWLQRRRFFFEAQGESASFLWFELLEGAAPFAEQLGQRVAILPVILFLVVGLIILLQVDEKAARKQVTESTPSP